MKNYHVIIVGGGAAGFFIASQLLSCNNNLEILLLEKGQKVLQKVKISGGGRCNVTHACFEPKELVKYYPRGHQELLGPFHKFQPSDTIQWFENHNVPLKIEKDNRVFPQSDNSQSIINCFLKICKNLEIHHSEGLINFYHENEKYRILTNKSEYTCNHLVITTGSTNEIWNLLKSKIIAIVPPVPSLFTFRFTNPWKNLSGISVQNVLLKIKDIEIQTNGDFLITHQGCSGPATLALSAWGARALYEKNYQFALQISWSHQKIHIDEIKEFAQKNAQRELHNACPLDLPNRLWKFLLYEYSHFKPKKWIQLHEKEYFILENILNETEVSVNGKNTFKEEFVTAGGVDLKYIHFKTMEHKNYENLYFAGEVLNIDAVTGGFNFQAAWTTGFIVAETILKRIADNQ